jgi:hypothetical protein
VSFVFPLFLNTQAQRIEVAIGVVFEWLSFRGKLA